MKKEITLGIVCFARKTFDLPAALNIYKSLSEKLKMIENIKLVTIQNLVIEITDARKAGKIFSERGVDAVVAVSGTFHLGHLILEIDKIVKKPILLWGLPELPYDGGKIRLNSICGLNLDASNLYKSGVKNYHTTIGENIDKDWIDAVRIISAFKEAHLGIAGFRAKGFFNLSFNDLNLYRELGILLDHYELQDLYNDPAFEKELKRRENDFKNVFDIRGITEEQFRKVVRLTAGMDHFIKRNSLDALAVRCWPEFAENYGISPCAAMSLLQSEHKIIACEGDVEGAVSMLAQTAIGAETPFLFDFSQVDFKQDFALFWHCGAAPCNLRDKKCSISLDTYFAGGKGVTADFVLKDGEVSILRIDSALDEYRMFLKKGKAVTTEKSLKGTYTRVVFNEPVSTVFRKIIDNGFAHHFSMVYGDYIRPLMIFAKLKGWKVID
ncbi:MAG: fucose isomerase [Spirochaetes bacterium]|nr:fucose isomerase [Spirochaetota bacterium]